MFFLCLLLVFLISAAQIFRIIMENRHSQVLQQELERMFFQEFSEPERSRGEDVQKIQEESEGINLPAYDFSALKKQNEDVYAYLMDILMQ